MVNISLADVRSGMCSKNGSASKLLGKSLCIPNGRISFSFLSGCRGQFFMNG